LISLTRDRAGVFNFERHQEAKGTYPALNLAHLSFSDGAFLYTDEQSGGKFEAANFSLDVRNLQITERKSAEILKNLSFTAEFSCPEVRSQGFIFSDVKFTCKGKDGIFTIDPLTMKLFGGQGSESIGMDFSHPVSRYTIRSTLSKFRIEEYMKTLSAKKVAEGAMDFHANLLMEGNSMREMERTSAGTVSLHGANLTLYGYDLDREFARFESSQNFNLVDAGAFFFAGPLGVLVTKGYNFASIFQGSGGAAPSGESSPTGRSSEALPRPGTWLWQPERTGSPLRGALIS
jgi:uncharacterized protein involved in outer membrane biogenesis